MISYHVTRHDPQSFSVTWARLALGDAGAPFEVPPDATAIMLAVNGMLGGAVHALQGSRATVVYDEMPWAIVRDVGGNEIRSADIGRVHVDATGAKFLRPVVEDKGEPSSVTFTLSVATP
jgi:hypothetical protein